MPDEPRGKRIGTTEAKLPSLSIRYGTVDRRIDQQPEAASDDAENRLTKKLKT